jgi:hypothetical protein
MVWGIIILITIACWFCSFVYAAIEYSRYKILMKDESRVIFLLFLWPIGIIYVVVCFIYFIYRATKCLFFEEEI